MPVNEPTSYFMRFIRQIERFLKGPRTAAQTEPPDWAYRAVDYVIVK